jgi:hypothetical protein
LTLGFLQYHNVLTSFEGLHDGVHLPRRVHMDQRVVHKCAWSSGGVWPPPTFLGGKAAPLADHPDLYKRVWRPGAWLHQTLAVDPLSPLLHPLQQLGEALEKFLHYFSTIFAGPMREKTSLCYTCAYLGGAARCGVGSDRITRKE